MKKPAKQKIVIVGCGNVAWHIAQHLTALKNFQITVYNHRENPNLNDFASRLKCKTVVGLTQIEDGADVYLLCVADKAIAKVADQITAKNPGALLLHTSGSVKVQDLGSRIHPCGVFYPLQTFSKEAAINWQTIPIIVEAVNRDSEHSILRFADFFSRTVISLDYKNRLKLHLAAVLVNNFTNSLYVSAFDLTKGSSGNNGLNFELLLPLIEQTTEKIKVMEPRAAQTGPAKRKDETVMEKHLHLLSKQNDLKKIYKQLSKLIAKQQGIS
jgi:predicted short-subunit dehydrogenase-like oxidoreductase (DUF2520 family)